MMRFEDKRGRFVEGHVLDDDRLVVTISNVAAPGTRMYKHPVWTWEESLVRENGGTRLQPRHLVNFTRLFGDRVDEFDPFWESESSPNDEDERILDAAHLPPETTDWTPDKPRRKRRKAA